jgi:hypothetical protein
MGSTVEMMMASIALIVNTFCLLVMAFLGNLIIAPIFNGLEQFVVGPQAIPWDMEWVIPMIWIILIILEIVCIVSFFIVSARRNVVGYDDAY